VAQAKAVAERMLQLSRKPTSLYHSPLERTSETARPIAELLGLKSRVDRGLIECDFGEWTGADLKSLRKKAEWASVQFRPSSFRFPKGESFTEMQHRMTTTLERLALRHPGETIVCVSHADPIKAAVAASAGIPLDLFQRLVISPCSVSAIVSSPDGISVGCVNTVGSLGDLGIS
jgi:probable phosphoglycerate mutase